MTGRVSCIIPTRNSESTLGACLASLRRQTHPDVELVVVDNKSSDDTPGIARRLADSFIDAGPERSAQRNAGARVATGTHLFFVDSDMQVDPDVVSEASREVEGGRVGVVIPEVSFGEGFWTQVKSLERSCYLGDETIEAARYLTRQAFEQIGGYDEEIVAGPEDWDLHERLRAIGSIGRTRAVIHHDEGRLRLRESMATKFYYGRATGAYLRKRPQHARRQLTVVRPAFLRHWRRLMQRPHLGVAVIVMKVCELGAGALGLLSARTRAGSAERSAPL
jgi:glycosyltransferase involved in cell wall biosynthesis